VDKNEPQESTFMHPEILENLIAKAQAESSEIHYVWHGGEPLIADLDYYRFITLLQQYYKRDESQVIYNNIQTNGTLLTSHFLTSLLKNNFSIGISYDANSASQAPSRPFISGKSSEESVRNGIELLKSHTGSVGVLCVITNENIKDAAGIFKRLSALGVNGVSFLPFKKNPYAQDMSVEPEDWAAFLIDIFELWLESDVIKNIEPISSMILGLMGGTPALCTYSNPCFRRYLCIYPQGDVYPCSSFVKPDMLLGNISQNNMRDIFGSLLIKELRDQWTRAIKDHCEGCSYIGFCYGGCPEYAFFEKDTLAVSEEECHARKEVLNHIARRLKELVPGKILDRVDYHSLAGCCC